MIRKTLPGSRTVSGLRTRYVPRSRIGQGFVGVAPWLDVVLIVLFFILLESKFTLQPGVVIDLPEAPFRDGLRSELIAVVLSVESRGQGNREEIVFFGDNRYLVKDADQMHKLRRAFLRGSRRHPDSGLIIEADKAVYHGTLVKLFNFAGEVGIKQVSIATREERQSGNGP
jgi:biopolymer transport protein ExbD